MDRIDGVRQAEEESSSLMFEKTLTSRLVEVEKKRKRAGAEDG